MTQLRLKVKHCRVELNSTAIDRCRKVVPPQPE